MRTAIFDLDGTLTDPQQGITRSVQYALESLGRPAPEASVLLWMIGPPLQESFGRLLGEDGSISEAVRLYRERYSATGLFENDVYPGVPLALEGLRDTGWKLLVATSKVRAYAIRILDHFALAGYFDAVYGSEFDGTRADKRDLLRFVVEHENLTPADAVMIGDREHDALGARANGIRALGVAWGYGSRDELLKAGVERVLETPQEILSALALLADAP